MTAPTSTPSPLTVSARGVNQPPREKAGEDKMVSSPAPVREAGLSRLPFLEVLDAPLDRIERLLELL